MNLKFSGHLDTLLGDASPAEKVAIFAELGFTGVELWCWWNYDLAVLADSLKQHKLEIAAICTKFVPLTDQEQRSKYMSGLAETIEACKALSCKTIISQVGNDLTGVSRDAQKQSIIDGLKEAAQILNGTGITLVIEPLNLLIDHAGYFLSRSDEAAEIIDAVDAPSIKMLFDIYHQQITEGNLINNIEKYISRIGHFHLADNPGRHQPGTGEINYRNVLKALENLEYRAYIGTEFFPEGDSLTALKKFTETFMG